MPANQHNNQSHKPLSAAGVSSVMGPNPKLGSWVSRVRF